MRRITLFLIVSSLSLISSSRLKYRASVKENVDLYHTIISLDQMVTVDYQQTIEFLNLNSPYTTYFLVDGQKLRTSRLIDREEFCRIKLCENSRCYPCEINMDFVLKENGQPRDIISLILTVEDINEFRPQFFDGTRDGQNIQLNISEGVPVGHVLPIPSATDKDGEDDELVYWIEKVAKIPFELISFGSNQIALNVTESLDREIRDSYELKLTARDRGNLTTTITIHISINDINDNVPIFDQQTPYIINISENRIPSSDQAVLRVHAVDNDTNENGRVVYNFSPQVSQNVRQAFRLNSQTGELFLQQSLDYEQCKEYRIPIIAQDSGPVSVPVYNLIIINVEDENDNKPLITIRTSDYFQFQNDTLYISEETPLNTLIMHVLVQDADSNLNGKVRCWIEVSDSLKLNLTNTLNNMFSIYTAQMFDHEQHSTYTFRLVVEDLGMKLRHQTVRDLRMVITDINDSPPKFSQSSYGLSLQADEEYHQPIMQFQATDADSNENGRISYELLSDGYQQVFSLDEYTGELFVHKKLHQSIYNLTIRAQDHGKYPSALHTDVSCLIKTLFKPKFEQEKYLFEHIDETVLMNSSIGSIGVRNTQNQSVNYSLTTSDFQIHPFTGELFVNTVLDYDTDPSCRKFFVIARNLDGLNSTCPVEVCLQPVNEYPPEIHLTSRLISINIDNNSLVNIDAFDRDSSPLSFLSFQCEKSSKCNLTCSSNGTILFSPSEHCIGMIDLLVSVNDNDQNPTFKMTNDTIHVIFYSNQVSIEKILASSNYTYTIEFIIILNVFIVILVVICLVCYCTHRQRKCNLLTKSTQIKILKDQIGFTENHSLLNDDLVDMTAINLKINTNSETSSSYNDSCYGSSEMDVHHHPQQQKSTGKLLVSSNEKYIVLCKDQETSSASSSPSSSSTIGNNVSLITKYQTNKRIQTTQLKSSDQHLEHFPGNHEYKKISGTSTTFNYRHITPLNEYYL
ncbi:unnamed protein product [Adineta ricciae]|uniref:Cadherin domain-containing protein n=1 Tax=Adineta ricciae TaxID=249248 RepID=A0A815Q107_ADIRI|nr:unnamed protein product [Adineta ricciae]CAF1455670.1 unnamed protein product [Adineta ricciae]